MNCYNARCEPVQAAFTHKAFTARSQGVDTKIINENGNNCLIRVGNNVHTD